MFYLVIDDQNLHVGETRYRDTTIFQSLDEAKNFAIRKAAKSKGAPECLIYSEVGTTTTTLPTEVTVTING